MKMLKQEGIDYEDIFKEDTEEVSFNFTYDVALSKVRTTEVTAQMLLDFNATMRLKDLKKFNVRASDIAIRNNGLQNKHAYKTDTTYTPQRPRPVKYTQDGVSTLSPNAKSFIQKPTTDPMNINPEDERNGDDGLSFYSGVQSRNELALNRRQRN